MRYKFSNKYLKARPETLSVKLLKTTIFVLLLFSLQTVRAQSPLPNGFAHNDYLHKHPLLDALANGYTNIEADIFLHGKKLIIAHFNPFFKNDRTLERLYLKPLSDRIKNNNGQVYKGYNSPVILMIDIKTGAVNTYPALKQLLEKYRPILSSYDHGQVHQGPVTVVLSGNKPYDAIKNEDDRLAFIDEDLRKTYQDTSARDVYKMSSCKYSRLIDWRGNGDIPTVEEDKLRAFVNMAHKFGKKVRLWASPENDKVWNELLKCKVDLINTDKLVVLKNFLISHTTTITPAATNTAIVNTYATATKIPAAGILNL